MATPSKEKTMSSRLMNMKFMQRTSAASSTSAKQSPQTQSPTTVTPFPAHKKRRLSPNGTYSTPGTPGTPATPGTPRVDGETTSHSFPVDTQETKWAFSFRDPVVPLGGLQVVKAGFGVIDASKASAVDEVEGEDGEDDDYEDEDMPTGRMAFGARKKKAAAANDEDEDDEAYSPPSGEGGGDSSHRANGASRNSGRRGTSTPKLRTSQLTSISSGGRSKGGPLTAKGAAATTTCFGCGRRGHLRRDCPSAGSGSRKGSRG